MELRLGTFNTFNRTQFRIYDSNLGNQSNNTGGLPRKAECGYSAAGDTLTASTFLHPINALRPRTVQLGLNYPFQFIQPVAGYQWRLVSGKINGLGCKSETEVRNEIGVGFAVWVPAEFRPTGR